MDITIFEKILKSSSRTIPLVLDEGSVLDCISHSLGVQIESLDACRTGNLENIYLYEKEEDKTCISVKVVRDWILDLSEKPYVGKNIYILRNFDEATHQAMNASLKALEEPPIHAIILLVVKNPESLLETIRSRTINLFSRNGYEILSPEIILALKSYVNGDVNNLIEILQSGKLDEATVLLILSNLIKICPKEHLDRIENSIEDLLEVHENPRNILDRAILFM